MPERFIFEVKLDREFAVSHFDESEIYFDCALWYGLEGMRL
jgi:hypothetical protein